MRIVRVPDLTNAPHSDLADYVGLTDVALRRKTEPAQGLYIAESTKVIRRALEAGHRPRSVLTLEKWLPDLEPWLGDVDVPCYVAPAAVLEELTGFHLHRGALAAMHRPDPVPVAELIRDATRVVVLEDIVDHTNVGAIFRSAAALGADAVLVSPSCADPLYRRSIRVSMGTVLQVPWGRLETWPGGLDELRAAGFTIAALALSDDAIPLDEFAASGPGRVALLLGTEGDGLSSHALDAADVVVTIPMRGGVDSLNVASASAVAIWALTH